MNNTEVIEALYVGLLGRHADAAGLEAHAAALASGTPLADVIARFAASPEFKSRHCLPSVPLPTDLTTTPWFGTIFDVGAHTGEDTIFYLEKGFRVIAVEAHPPHAQFLKERFQTYLLTNQLSIEAFGIGKKHGTGHFFVHDTKTDWHRSEIDPTDPSAAGFKETSVQYIEARTLFQKYGVPYYLKVDIEGSDHLMVTAIAEEERPPFVSFEHSRQDLTNLCLSHLEANGYCSFQVVDQQSKPEQLPALFPAKEGRFVQPRFSGHTSGLFGYELPPRWTDIHSLITILANLDCSSGQWYDIHASRFRRREDGTLER